MTHLQVLVLQILVLQIHVLQVHILQVHLLQVLVLQILVLQIQSTPVQSSFTTYLRQKVVRHVVSLLHSVFSRRYADISRLYPFVTSLMVK